MNTTDTAAPPPPPPPPSAEAGPRVSPTEMRDLGRLRRSRYGATLGGVCDGIAKHLDVDPTVVKVVFVALSFFGGAGLLLYAALWILVPREGEARGVVPAGDDTRKVLLVAVLVVAALVLLGNGWGDWWFGSGVPLTVAVLAVGAFFLVRRDRRREAAGQVAPVESYDDRPAWAPPPYVPPAQRAPKRRGILLFLPTLALIAVALGALGAYDANHVVDESAYPALALAVSGAVLVLGAFWGRAGGVALIGIVSAVVLAVSSAVGGFGEGSRQSFDPDTAAQVRPTYDMGNGQLVVNLSNLSDVAALDGRTVRITGRAGEVEVVVPRDLRVRVRADVEVVGGIGIGLDQESGGIGPSASRTFSGTSTSPVLDLDIDIRVGQITVRNDRE